MFLIFLHNLFTKNVSSYAQNIGVLRKEHGYKYCTDKKIPSVLIQCVVSELLYGLSYIHNQSISNTEDHEQSLNLSSLHWNLNKIRVDVEKVVYLGQKHFFVSQF